jgi:hypothetical protein
MQTENECLHPSTAAGEVLQHMYVAMDESATPSKGIVNEANPYISYVIQLKVKDGFSKEDMQKWIVERAVPGTHKCDEPKTMRFDWYLSEDGKEVTMLEMFEDSDGALTRGKNLFASAEDKELPLLPEWMERLEPTSFKVYGAVSEELKEFTSTYMGATFPEYAGGFMTAKKTIAGGAPNGANPTVTYVIQLEVKDGFSKEDIQQWIRERAVPGTHKCDEPKTMRFEWFLSEDGKEVTMLEMFEDSDGAVTRGKNLCASAQDKELPLLPEWMERFTPLNVTICGGPVQRFTKDFLAPLGATYQDYVGGFLHMQ